MISIRPTTAPFLRLDNRIGWQSQVADKVYFNPRRNGLMLGKEGQYSISPFEPTGTLGGTTLPRGLAATPKGFVLLADPQHDRILGYDPGRWVYSAPESLATEPPAPFAPLWESPQPSASSSECLTVSGTLTGPERSDPYRLKQPRDLIFSRNGELVVADTGHRRLLFLLWPSLRIRRIIELEARPWALAEDSRNRLWVLLRSENQARVVRLDPLGRTEMRTAPDAVSPGATQIAVNARDQVFILDAGARRLQKLTVTPGPEGESPRPKVVEAMPEEIFQQDFPAPLRLREDTLLLPQSGRPDCPPLPLPELSIDRAGRLHGTSLPLMALPRRITVPRSGVWISEALDGEQDSWSWHRVLLEAELPDNTSLVVQTYTDKAQLTETQLATLGDRWSRPLTLEPGQKPEVLVQSLPARYLWLRIEFRGDGSHSPLVRGMDIEAPRRSSLRFLPPPFHREPESRHFLDRFLSYFDTLFAEVEYEIDHFARRLDTASVPSGDFLEWLGTWFNLTFLAQWPPDLRRTMIRQAIPHFRQRGTLSGLRQMLRWHTGLGAPMPQIIEHYRLREGDMAAIPIARCPLMASEEPLAHRFTVALPAFTAPDQTALEQLERLIEAQKPAHTHYQLRLFEPGIHVASQATLGVDALLGHNPDAPLGEKLLSDPRDDALRRTKVSGTAVKLSGRQPVHNTTHSFDQ